MPDSLIAGTHWNRTWRKKASGIPALYLKQHKECRRCYHRFPAQSLLTRMVLTQLPKAGFQAQTGGFNIAVDDGAPVVTVSPNILQPAVQGRKR
ncbi:TPA: hypothetical protein ACGPD3_000438 [Klebsiella pneumoniae]